VAPKGHVHAERLAAFSTAETSVAIAGMVPAIGASAHSRAAGGGKENGLMVGQGINQ
jgi:hypothetical protein